MLNDWDFFMHKEPAAQCTATELAGDNLLVSKYRSRFMSSMLLLFQFRRCSCWAVTAWTQRQGSQADDNHSRWAKDLSLAPYVSSVCCLSIVFEAAMLLIHKIGIRFGSLLDNSIGTATSSQRKSSNHSEAELKRETHPISISELQPDCRQRSNLWSRFRSHIRIRSRLLPYFWTLKLLSHPLPLALWRSEDWRRVAGMGSVKSHIGDWDLAVIWWLKSKCWEDVQGGPPPLWSLIEVYAIRWRGFGSEKRKLYAEKDAGDGCHFVGVRTVQSALIDADSTLGQMQNMCFSDGLGTLFRLNSRSGARILRMPCPRTASLPAANAGLELELVGRGTAS
ncbi:uncharacterized protein MYCFIDRAFT_207813 [Pseudocercospora fijiensis CIRAD86]|uniref:Uncharacterized protein n=1 Tax=Pseudocercospora fijiensis (strain CIRAD86) TaxID=383855 RepID=M3B290_PSEFD|nr:uncharacterized protein MYCFIDRAFT_207813 [Pseudocercospora fijiensis CIRAD86]EME83488.1 hypothetical protein MYCFIDRAFT_207813 [Pseudocercospora fijiensis CIRAD86]